MPGRPPTDAEKAALAESAKLLREAEQAYQPAPIPITEEIKGKRKNRQEEEEKKEKKEQAAKQAKTPPANKFGEIANKATELTNKPEIDMAATPVTQLKKELEPKDKKKLLKVEAALETENALEAADNKAQPSNEVLSFDEALKRYNDSPSRNYYSQSTESRYELVEYYRAWLKTFKDEERKAKPPVGYETLLVNFSNAQKASDKANTTVPPVPADINKAKQDLDDAQIKIETYKKQYPDLALAYSLAKHAQDRIQRPRRILASLEKAATDPTALDYQKPLYDTLVLIEKAERRIARLDNKQQLAEATLEDQMALWNDKWQAEQKKVFKKEFVTYGEKLPKIHNDLVNDVLKPAVENNQKLKQELYQLEKDLTSVEQAITLQKQAQNHSRGWYERKFGDQPESLNTLEAAEERMNAQFKRIKIEIEASEKTVKELFEKANKPLNEGYHDFIKEYIIDYKSWSNYKRVAVAVPVIAGIVGPMAAATTTVGASVATAVFTTNSVGASIAAALTFSSVAVPPLLLLIPAAAVIVAAYNTPRYIVYLGDKWNEWREKPFSSEGGKEEFLIARVAGTNALTRILSTEKNEQGEKDVLNICMYISKWSSREDIRKQVEQFLGECMAQGLVETDPETGEKTLCITNIPKAQYIQTRATLVVLAGRFNIRLTGPAFDKVEDIQNVEEYKTELASEKAVYRAIDKEYEKDNPNVPETDLENVVNAEILLPKMVAGNNPDGRDQARSDLHLAEDNAKNAKNQEDKENENSNTGHFVTSIWGTKKEEPLLDSTNNNNNKHKIK